MTDFTFMKTGFDLLQPDDDEFKQNTAAIIVTYAEQALKTAAMYVSHHETRNGITPEDIKRAMMLEMFLFKNRSNLLEKSEAIKKMLFEDEDNDDEEEFINMTKEEEFSQNECSCALCKCVNGIYDRWNGWTPQSLFETVIKKHIDNI
uniref:Uncharacterized protein n=1 Tax=viral metagenome TaxID=1070528 RepID=A0A6C0C4H7_9ZZZZ